MAEKNVVQALLQCASQYKLTHDEITQILSECVIDAWQSLYGYGYELEFVIDDNNIALNRVTHGVQEIQNNKIEFIGSGIRKERIEFASFPHAIIEKTRQNLNILLLQKKKENEYNKYKDHVGELFHCYIKQSANKDGNMIVIVDGIYEGIIFQRENNKKHMSGTIRCRLKEIKQTGSAEYQLIFERSSQEFLELLLEDTIPEIKNGSILVLSIARDPGNCTKLLLDTNPDMPGSSSVNVIGACLGYNNCRKNLLSAELNGEKIHFYVNRKGADEKSTIRANIFNCFSKIPIIDILFNEDGEVAVVVPVEEVPKCIGKNGSFINLTKKLLNLNITILSDIDYQKIKQSERDENKKDFLMLNFSDTDAEILSEITIHDLNKLKKYLDKVSNVQKLTEYIHELEEKQRLRYVSLGGDKKFFNSVEGLSLESYFILLDHGIKDINTLKSYNPHDLAELTGLSSDLFVF